MILTDIQAGSPISLEMTVGDSSYEFPTSVVSVKSESIIIDAISYKGNAIDFGKKKGLIFSIYSIDPSNETRIVWKNVSLETIQYTNNGVTSAYYRVKTNGFACMASACERRANNRIAVNVQGWISFDVDNVPHQITVNDVSEKGISFVTLNDFEMLSNTFYISFSDTVNDKPFVHRFRCVQVRQSKRGLQTFYGCTIPSPTKDYLTYVFLKKLGHKLDLKNSEKIAKEKAEAAAIAEVRNKQQEESNGTGFHSTLRN